MASAKDDADQIDAALREKLRNTNYGVILAARGITTVALDEDANIVEYRPDGTTRVIEQSRDH